jgi:serine phosphatase RsbU (regulator of sigma subunit)
MDQLLLAIVSLGCLAATVVWGRSARYRQKLLRRLERESVDADVKALARSDFRKDLHTTVLYSILALDTGVAAAYPESSSLLLALVAVPVALSLAFGRNFVKEARIEHSRSELERRAQEVLVQEDLAPRRWAARLAPEDLPAYEGFEVGHVYQAGSGLMAGDFYDVFRPSPNRIAAVIGDVAGHGIDPAITAFQAKYLLRVFLRQYRDPAQALEELNTQMSAMGRPEEFISLVVVVFDPEAETLRYASAGHPTAFIWHERTVQPLRATGPLLMLDPNADYTSNEIRMGTDDIVLAYTDGLSEVRNGGQLFGEERVANALRRDPGQDPDVLCKSLLEAARDFSTGPIGDDVAILAIRKS